MEKTQQARTRKIVVRADKELHANAHAYCKRTGVGLSELTRALLQGLLGNTIAFPGATVGADESRHASRREADLATRDNVSGREREAIIARDRGTCRYCGQAIVEPLHLDHVIPRTRGGPTLAENLVCACGPCNRRKRDRTPEEAGMVLLPVPQEQE